MANTHLNAIVPGMARTVVAAVPPHKKTITITNTNQSKIQIIVFGFLFLRHFFKYAKNSLLPLPPRIGDEITPFD